MDFRQSRFVAVLIATAGIFTAAALAAQTDPGTAVPRPSVEGLAPAKAGIQKVAGDIRPPTLRTSVEPEYTEAARKAKANGKVTVNLIVDTGGRPQNVHILHGFGMGLDENALAAVKQYTFNPATKDGRPIAVELNIEVNFMILDHPKFAYTVRAELTDEGRRAHFYGVVRVGLDIDEHGLPHNIRVITPVGMGLDENAVTAVQQFRFKPAKRNDGGPALIPAVVTVEFKKK